MLDLGTVRPGSTIYIPVNTFDSNDPSASVTITNWANTDCHVHKDGGTTQRASSAGETLSINFDSITGNHLLAIDLADNTTANFYEAGSTYHVRIEGTTVDAATINAWIAQWRIGYPGAILDTTIATLASQTSFTLEDGSADNNAYNGCVAIVHDLASAVQVALGYVSAYTGATKTITLGADPGVFTMAAGDSFSIFPPSNVRAISEDTTAPDNLELMFDGTGYAGGSTNLQVDTVAVSGDSTAADNLEADYDGTGYNKSASTVGTATAVTNEVTADVTKISGDATAANNAELFFDGTGYDAANSTVGTVTALASGAVISGAIAAAELNNIADALLKRDMSAVSGEADRSPLNALRFLRNKWSISGTTLTVTQEDDSTSAWTSTLTATAGADPVTASDPA
jgi:hypothetical protein